MKSTTRVTVIGKDYINMDEPTYLSEVGRSEAHEEVLKRLVKVDSPISYEELEKDIERSDGIVITMLASPLACTVVRNTGDVVIYDIPGYSLCFLPEVINDFQKEFLEVRYMTSQEQLLGYYLEDQQFLTFEEMEGRNHTKFYEILENQYQKGREL